MVHAFLSFPPLRPVNAILNSSFLGNETPIEALINRLTLLEDIGAFRTSSRSGSRSNPASASLLNWFAVDSLPRSLYLQGRVVPLLGSRQLN